MRITGENSSVMLAYFHTCSSSSLAVIMLKYFSCLAAGIAWTTWSATCLSLRMSSSRALMASSLLRGRHKTIGCRLIVFSPPHVCLALTQSACRGGGTRCKDPALPSHAGQVSRYDSKDKTQRGVGWTSTVHQRFSMFLFTFFSSSASLQTLKVW